MRHPVVLTRSRSLKLAMLLLLGAAAAGTGPAWAGEPCRSVSLAQSLSWVTSGAWDEAGNQLYIVDTAQRQVFAFTPDGRLASNGPGGAETDLSSFLPARIQGQGSELFLQLIGDRFVRLGKNFHPLGKSEIHGKAVQGQTAVDKVFLWHVAGNDLIVYADVRDRLPNGTPDWTSGFLRIPLKDPAGFQFLSPSRTSFRDPERTFYKLGMQFIGSLGSTAYILRMESTPSLYANRKGSGELERLTALPDELRVSPVLPGFSRTDDLPGVMSAVERSTLPVSLVGWKGYLYITYRVPLKGGTETEWRIAKIDPRKDRLVGTAILPSHAHHLTVIPGNKNWTLIERSVVTGFGEQDVTGAVMIPATRLQAFSGDAICR